MSILRSNVSIVAKLPLYLLLALSLNIALFMLIHNLVSREFAFDRSLQNINLVDFIRVKEQPKPLDEQIEPEELEQPELEQEPPPPDMPEPDAEQPQQEQLDLSMPSIDIPLSLSGSPYLGDFATSTRSAPISAKPRRPKIDTNVKPTLRIPPVYPQRALRSGIEGVVTVEFTITTDGSVKDAEVVKAKPPKIFNRAVLTAIAKWKFNPDIVNGKAVEKRARQDVKFTIQR